MGEFYGAAWVNQLGDVNGSAWKTWCNGLKRFSVDEIAGGVHKWLDEMPKYPPSLADFTNYCRGSVEDRLGLEGRELEFTKLMNFVTRPPNFGEQRDMSQLNPVMYFVYCNLDIYNWRRMNLRDSRSEFNRIYDRAMKLARNGYEFPSPPPAVETSEVQSARRNKQNSCNDQYQSKRKAVGKAALAEMRKLLA